LGAIKDVVVWLRSLGLGKYEALRESDIDETVPPRLTQEDLKEIGVGPVGHRRIILEAIATLRADSTGLSARIDPEDLRELIPADQKCVAEAVGRLGGFVAKYMGDGVLIYFGFPQAQEDEPERAVRAGLELVAAVGRLKTQAALQTRVGIATRVGGLSAT
jgi:class 3 adenylate cyclase